MDNWQKLELSRCPRVESEDTVGRSQKSDVLEAL